MNTPILSPRNRKVVEALADEVARDRQTVFAACDTLPDLRAVTNALHFLSKACDPPLVQREEATTKGAPGLWRITAAGLAALAGQPVAADTATAALEAHRARSAEQQQGPAEPGADRLDRAGFPRDAVPFPGTLTVPDPRSPRAEERLAEQIARAADTAPPQTIPLLVDAPQPLAGTRALGATATDAVDDAVTAVWDALYAYAGERDDEVLSDLIEMAEMAVRARRSLDRREAAAC